MVMRGTSMRRTRTFGSPCRMRSQKVNNIAAGLKKLLPGNEAQIERNRSAYEKRLLSLDAELAQMLAPIRGAEIISFHEAYDYFAQRYGLVIAGAIETHDAGSRAQRS